MPQDPQGPQLEPHHTVGHRLPGGEPAQGLGGQIEKLRMRIIIVGQFTEQLRNVIAGVKTGKVTAGRTKPPQELGLGQQVQRVGRFAEEDYSTKGQYVKSRLERTLQPPAPLG